MPRRKRTTVWDRFREEVKGGAIHEHTSLSALAEQAEALAAVQEDAAKRLRASNVHEMGVEVLRHSAEAVRGIAANLRLHAFTHMGEEPRALEPEEVEQLLAKMP